MNVIAVMMGALGISTALGGIGAAYRSTSSLLQWLIVIMIFAAFGCSTYEFINVYLDGKSGVDLVIGDWINIKPLVVQWKFHMGALSAFMCFVICSVSSMVHVYSIWYMHDDKNPLLFLFYLSLFTLLMSIMVLSTNFLQLFLGWEGVGFCSYLLIGFWGTKAKSAIAADKAFIMNRVGDFGLIIGILLIYGLFGSLNFSTVFSALGNVEPEVLKGVINYSPHLIDIIAACILIGCIGKSAQIVMHGWLVDAMEGPTPASSLIHAATMVTAGVFMMACCSDLFNYAYKVRGFALVIGVITALVMALIAVFQNDIKKIIAYSTCSQLGYMFAACGAGFYSLAMFHLFTHAFFKSLLFLCAGNIIHASSGEQDIRKIGNISHALPLTKIVMCIAALAITGIAPFAGYFSKDLIIEAIATSDGLLFFFVLVLAALLTSAYTWKIFLYVFCGQKGSTQGHESFVSTIPMSFLALMSIVTGFYGKSHFKLFASNVNYHYLDKDGNYKYFALQSFLDKMHSLPIYIKLMPTGAALFGMALSYILYKYYNTDSKFGKFISSFFDNFYSLFIKMFYLLGKLGKWTDVSFIDMCTSRFAAGALQYSALGLSALHTGKVYHYALAMTFGIVVMISLVWLVS